MKTMAITFIRLQSYLTAIAAKANGDAANSGHGVFWNTTYQVFITANVPSKTCNGQPVPIVNQADKPNSAFNLILRAGWCGKPQMPKTGPYLTDKGYTVKLSDGTIITGQQILDDIQNWLVAGAPENG
jgi:hypothetical protein